MSLPNLIIAGAPKCGTSSLFKWLSDHPRACGSRPKETFYLMDEGHPLLKADANYHRHGMEGYRRYFDHCSEGCEIVFEATTHYIYQQTALEVLSKLTPMPRIIFVLRKPSERVYSSFQYTKNNLANLNKRISFPQYVEMASSDADGSLLDAEARESAYVLKNDIRYSRYVEYISRWVERFGSERIHVLLFEQMSKDPRSFMRKLAAEIGLDPRFYDDYSFPLKNETIRIERQGLHRGVRKLEGVLPSGALKEYFKSLYLKFQSSGAKPRKSAEDEMALAALEREFRPFNERLAAQFGLDLSHWN